jgi:hypothetical protein
MPSNIRVVCVDCAAEFVVTGDQRRWAIERGYTPLKRCLACRNRRRKNKAGGGHPPTPLGSPAKNPG